MNQKKVFKYTLLIMAILVSIRLVCGEMERAIVAVKQVISSVISPLPADAEKDAPNLKEEVIPQGVDEEADLKKD